MNDEPGPAPVGEQAFQVSGAEFDPPPLVLSSPHSGQTLPASFMQQTRLAPVQLRRADDCFVDELLAGAVAAGVPLIAARFARTFVDLNRHPHEIDPAMFTAPPLAEPPPPSERVTAGLGVIPRIVAPGVDIYARKLPPGEAARRIAEIHAPYHEALAALIERARARHGYAVLLDCHSMPSMPARDGSGPEVVLGDLHGRSAAPGLVAHLETKFVRMGYRVARNAPYAGGYTTERHGAPDLGVHVVQIEVDRALYMDQVRLVRHSGFRALARALTEVVVDLLQHLPALNLGPETRLAAE